MTAPVEPYRVPFTILIDSAEGEPFEFRDLYADAAQQFRPLAVTTKWACLGRHPDSLGDYSVDGLVGRVGVERKSLMDCIGTVLGWENHRQRDRSLPGRRQRFERELANLSSLQAGVIVVEASIGECLKQMPTRGKKSADDNRKIFHRSVLAYRMDYRVQWEFSDDRRLAEIFTFRWLERFHRKACEAAEQGAA